MVPNISLIGRISFILPYPSYEPKFTSLVPVLTKLEYTVLSSEPDDGNVMVEHKSTYEWWQCGRQQICNLQKKKIH